VASLPTTSTCPRRGSWRRRALRIVAPRLAATLVLGTLAFGLARNDQPVAFNMSPPREMVVHGGTPAPAPAGAPRTH
jgi:hypothetical protein